MKLKFWHLYILLLAIGFVYLYSQFTKLKAASEASFVSYPKVTDTYLDLFPLKSRQYIQPNLTYFRKGRRPIATFDYINNNYRLIVYEIGELNSGLSLKDIINYKEERAKRSLNTTYDQSIILNGFDFMAANIQPKNINNIYLNLEGDSTKSIKADSLISYNFNIKTLSINFNEKEPVSFFIEKKRSSFFKKLPSELLFLKKNKIIYMILLFSNSSENQVSNGTLYKLMTLK